MTGPDAQTRCDELMRMRPVDVKNRMLEVAAHERALVESRAGGALRVAVHRLVDLCARLGDADDSVGAVLRTVREIDRLSTDPAQLRTGSDFELRCLACAEQLRSNIGDRSAPPERDVLWGALERVPPLAILGGKTPDTSFDLVCWNEANCVEEHVQRPFLAAALIRLEGDHRPADRFGLVEPMTELAIRYEDVPEERAGTAAEITRMLAEFRARAPWPVLTPR
jgi:hypothetical protein